MSTTVPKLTYAEYACYPDDGHRHEIIDGDHYMNPAPNIYHQVIAQRINHQLYTQVELQGLGRVFFAPIDVQLGPHDIVQPDLLVVLEGNRIIKPSRIIGPPDHVIEILSPSSDGSDRSLKRTLYQRAGVKEYWIVDPAEASLTQLVLGESSYEVRDHGEVVAASYAADIRVDFARVW